MKRIAKTLIRLAVFSSTALGLATVSSWHSHRGYWHGTIRRVQTVDFNLLSHVLPTKLSYALIEQDIEELQRTLDSNYGYFGMVVTDCAMLEQECDEQNILYSTDSRFSWKKQLDSQTLSGLPYNVLRNPPPLKTEAGFERSRDETWRPTGNTNKGQIIGRVYYVRGIPPTYSADLLDWLKKLPKSLIAGSGADKYYVLTFGAFLFFGVALWSGVEFVLYRKKVLEQVASERQRRLESEQQIALDRQKRAEVEKQKALFETEQLKRELGKREQEISQLIGQRESILAKSVEIQEKTQQQAQQLEDEIVQTRYRLQQSHQHYEEKLAIELKAKAEAEARLKQQEDKLALLQHQQQTDVQISEQLESQLSEAQNLLKTFQSELSAQSFLVEVVESENATSEEFYQQEIRLKEQILEKTKEELVKTKQSNEKQQQLLEKLRSDKNEIEQRYQLLNQQLELNIDKLKEELDKSRTDLIEQRNVKEYLALLEEENEHFKSEIEQFKVKARDEESKYRNLEAQYRSYRLYSEDLRQKLAIYQKEEVNAIDLKTKVIALIGGDREVREKIIRDLKEDFALSKAVEIPPAWEQKTDLSTVKQKIKDAHYIFHFTGRTKHETQNILRELKHKLPGEIFQINSNGYSGGLRDILAYLAEHR